MYTDQNMTEKMFTKAVLNLYTIQIPNILTEEF